MLSEGRSIIWTLPESLEPELLVTDISAAFQTEIEQAQAADKTWYDTFDWRLYKRGFYLYCDEAGWNLLHKDTEKVIASAKADSSSGPFFARNLPTGRIRSLVEPALEMRSLLALVRHATLSTCLRILNSDAKTVARIFLEEHSLLDSRTVFWTVRLQDVRGYQKKFKQLVKFFKNYGLQEAADSFSPYIKGLELIGRKPLDYSSKFNLHLEPDHSAMSSMVDVYKQLLETMQRNEFGILEDLDSEFLHDFRVAVRRTRSGLSQIKKVLPGDVTRKAKKDFAWLGSITGPTRDLDVYLLNEQNYRKRLPERLQKGLDTFFADILDRRNIEQQKLVQYMQTEKYRQVLGHWHDFLYSEIDDAGGKNSGRPVVEPAREIIFRKYKKVMKDGKAITEHCPDEKLHRLRIDCKKLRYILEFFSSLFPSKEMKKIIKILKSLQDNLGDFNDLSVQQDMLREYLASLRPGSRKNQELAAALGGLLTNLYHEQQSVRKEFAAKFRKYSAIENRMLYRKLFREELKA